VHLNCSNLFNRLIVLMERQIDMAMYFSYELTAVPASMFKDDMMRKPDKSALVDIYRKTLMWTSLHFFRPAMCWMVVPCCITCAG